MAHYLCRFLDDAGQVRSEVPLIGSTENDVIVRARDLFRRRNEPGGFELWTESRCFLKETPAANDRSRESARPVRV